MEFDYGSLIDLVQYYSPTGQEGPAVSWLVERMKGLGYTQAFIDQAGNAVGVMGDGPQQIVLLGHIDTVDGEIAVHVEGDSMYGRGAVDAKGPLAAFTDAVARVGPITGWQLIVIGAVDEEGESKGARYVIRQADSLPNIPCYAPAYAIIGEPSGWSRITLGYKGSAWARLTVRRARAHTASQGESACEAAVVLWDAVRAWAENYNAGRSRVMEQVLPTLRGMQSGQDDFQELATLQVSVRLPGDFGPELWYRQLQALVGDAVMEPVGYPIPAYQAEKNTPLVRAFLVAIRAAGGTPGFVYKAGTADLNIVAPAWGCPALAYGPGDSALDHTPDERISLEEYRRAVLVLEGVIRSLVEKSSPGG